MMSSTTLRTFALFLVIVAPTTLAYNVNNERTYTKAIEKSLKKPLVAPIKASAAPAIPFVAVPPTVIPEEDGPPNYWFHPQIHTFGNTGILGAIHAAVAPIATLMIDMAAYDGENVRVKIGRDLRNLVGKAGANVADLCCGVGISTRALRDSFNDAENIVGVDTSPEMIAMANVLSSDNLVASIMSRNSDKVQEGACEASYAIGNAEGTKLPEGSFDLVTIMYGFHEVPFMGRDRILNEARRLLAPGGTLAIVDISPDYEPSKTMLAGEPYVLEYKQNIQTQLKAVQGFVGSKYKEMIKGHVGVWVLERKDAVEQSMSYASLRP